MYESLCQGPRRGYARSGVEEARDLLAQIFGWLTEESDAADLKEAKALLAELS